MNKKQYGWIVLVPPESPCTYRLPPPPKHAVPGKPAKNPPVFYLPAVAACAMIKIGLPRRFEKGAAALPGGGSGSCALLGGGCASMRSGFASISMFLTCPPPTRRTCGGGGRWPTGLPYGDQLLKGNAPPGMNDQVLPSDRNILLFMVPCKQVWRLCSGRM